MKKLLTIIFSLFILLTAIGWITITFFPQKLVPMMLNQQMKRLNQGDDLLKDTESITIYTVGTSSPMPGNRAQIGTAVLVNGHFFMFDVGVGVVQKAENMGLPLNKIDGVFITHYHSDHFMDLPYLISRSWVLGRTNDLHLYGPDGLDTLTHAIDQLLHIENQHRVAHHGAELMDISKARGIPHEFKNVQGGKEVVYQQDGITITAFDVNHEPIEPAVGYAIEYKGKKVVISGDTKKNDMVLEMAKNADLLLHEVLLVSLLQQMEANLEANGQSRNSKIIHDIQDYHTSPADVAEIAAKAKVKRLVLHHFVPAPDLKVVENLYRRELKEFEGEVIFAEDGDGFVVE
ncbi:MAG: MBL fold metallo-hydrolase [Chitinophagales bacterium]